MLGYVTAQRAELRMREYDIYRGYYCGICKSIGTRMGQAPRMVLSYDSVFLAMLLAGLEESEDSLSWEHCIVHPIKKIPVGRSKAMDYAADVMALLAYYNALDDCQDGGGVKALLGKTAMTPAVKKLLRTHPEYRDLCASIETSLGEMSALEKEKCQNFDKVGERFALIMESIFTFYYSSCGETLPKREGPLREIGKHLGKWIYLIDAVDDLADDMKTGNFNPLIYRFEYGGGDPKEFWKGIKDKVEFNLYQYLGQIADAYDLLDIRKNKDIIENIIFLGLRTRTEGILEKGVDNPKAKGKMEPDEVPQGKDRN